MVSNTAPTVSFCRHGTHNVSPAREKHGVFKRRLITSTSAADLKQARRPAGVADPSVRNIRKCLATGVSVRHSSHVRLARTNLILAQKHRCAEYLGILRQFGVRQSNTERFDGGTVCELSRMEDGRVPHGIVPQSKSQRGIVHCWAATKAWGYVPKPAAEVGTLRRSSAQREHDSDEGGQQLGLLEFGGCGLAHRCHRGFPCWLSPGRTWLAVPQFQPFVDELQAARIPGASPAAFATLATSGPSLVTLHPAVSASSHAHGTGHRDMLCAGSAETYLDGSLQAQLATLTAWHADHGRVGSRKVCDVALV